MVNEYLAEVKGYLTGIPADEREELLQFYAEQMMDAGLSTDEIIAKYGTPKQFARTLKIDYFIEADEDQTGNDSTGVRTKKRANLIWLIVLGLFATPVMIPLAIVLVIGLIGVIVAFLMAIFTIYAGIIGVLAAGLFVFVMGIMVIGQSLATAMLLIGVGIFLTAAVIFVAPIVWALTKWLFELVVQFVKWLGRRFLAKQSSVEGEV